MIKKELKKYMENQLEKQQALDATTPTSIELYKLEKEFLEQHSSILEEMEEKVIIVEKDPVTRFQDVYIEKCNKESEELISEETVTFLDQPIGYFHDHLEEFMYLESPWFDVIGIDAISFEVDSVFKTYIMMTGAKIQKKHEETIRTFLSTHLNGDDQPFDLIFNNNEGIWELNFVLNKMNGFQENWTIRDAYSAGYDLLFRLRESIEEGRK